MNKSVLRCGINIGIYRLWRLKERGIHHNRNVAKEQTVIYKLAVFVEYLLIKLVVAGITSPKLADHFMIALNYLKGERRLVICAPFTLKVFFANVKAKLIGLLGVISYHEIDVRICAGCSACKGLCAVGVGENVIAVAVTFCNGERGMYSHPKDKI